MNNEPATHEPIMRYSVEASVVQRGLGRAVSREASIEFDTSVEQNVPDGTSRSSCLCLCRCLRRFENVDVSRDVIVYLKPNASIRVTLKPQTGRARITSVQYACILCDGRATASR